MDPVRIESYLRAACSVLDFDIGELWCATMLPDQKPSLRFINKYKTPTYEDFYTLLVEPRLSLRAQTHSQREEDKHGFSPIICRGVCDGGQIVWANTHLSEGLNGRTDLPLNTAVGVPICSLAGELYILVLFAVGIVSVTPHAMEFLTTLARAIAEPAQTDISSEMDTDTHIDTHTHTNNDTLSSTTLTSLPQSAHTTHSTHKSGFLSAALASHPQPVTRARTEDFVGRYAINELIQRYAHEVEFHLLPMHKLQRFFDCNEIMLFCDLFMDFKLSRDGKFTRKQLQSLRETYARERERERSGSCGSEESGAWDLGDRETQKPQTVQPENVEDGEGEDLAGLFLNDEELSLCPPTPQQPVHPTQTPQLKQTTEVTHTAQETQGPGAYCVDLNSIVAPLSNDAHSPHAHTTQIHTHSGLALEISPGLPKSTSHNTQGEEDDRTQPTQLKQPTQASPTDSHEQHTSILHIYAHMTYKLSQCRFHEFLIAVVGMTVFEAAEMWLVSEHGEPHTLTLVAAVYRSPAMQPWIARSESLRLQVPSDGKAPLFGPAKVVDNGHNDWDSDVAQLNAQAPPESHNGNSYSNNPNTSPTEENDDSTQRVRTARACGVRTSLGIPLQGLRGVCGALMFYTSLAPLSAEPLLVQFLECAVSLLASSSLQESSWTRLEDKVALAMREQHTQTQSQTETEQRTQGGTETDTQPNHEHMSMICESVCEPVLATEENAQLGENLIPTNDDQMNKRAQCPPMQRWLSEAHALPLSSHTSAGGSALSGEMPAPPARTQPHTQPQTLALPLTKRMASSHIDLTQISAQSERESLPPSLATQLIIDKKLSTFDQRVRFWRNTLTDRAQPNGNSTHTTATGENVQNNTMTTSENENTSGVFSDDNRTNDISTDAPTGTVPRARSRSSLSLALDPQSLSSINPYTYHILQQQQQHNTPHLHNTQQHALLSLSAAATAAIMRSNPSLVALANAPQTLSQAQTNTSSSAHTQASSPSLPVGGAPAGAGFVFQDGVRVGDTLGEDWNDHVVNAAITLANFGKVSSASTDGVVCSPSAPVCAPISSHYNSGALGVSTSYTSTAPRKATGMEWSSFLEGSNNGVNFRCALDSHKVLAAAQDSLPQTLSGHKRGFADTSSSENASLPKCKVDDCPHSVESATVHYCAQHRGTRRCQKEGCHKCAQGATRFCIAHGGGRRCTYPGCTKGARDKFFCAAHGGGKRCSQAGCTKSAVGGSDLCTAHGGGKRCQYPGCTKSSQSSTRFCVRHGGGKCCAFEGCTKVARGKTNYCASHGGGVRCRFASCNKLAVGAQQLCRTHQSLSSEEQALLPPLVHVDDEDYEGGDGEEDFSVSVKEEPMLAQTCAAPKKRKSTAK